MMITDTSQVQTPELCPGCSAPAWRQTFTVFHAGYGTWQVTCFHHQDFTPEELDAYLADLDTFYEDLAVKRRELRALEPIVTTEGDLRESDFDVPVADPENLWTDVTPTALLVAGSTKTPVSAPQAALAAKSAADFSADLTTVVEA